LFACVLALATSMTLCGTLEHIHFSFQLMLLDGGKIIRRLSGVFFCVHFHGFELALCNHRPVASLCCGRRLPERSIERVIPGQLVVIPSASCSNTNLLLVRVVVDAAIMVVVAIEQTATDLGGTHHHRNEIE
jgi:hypothetical protein